MKKISWEEMKNEYPEEWLLITDFDLDASGHILAGVVDRHSKQKDLVYRSPALKKPVAFRYTGESNFSGLRSHAGKHHVV